MIIDTLSRCALDYFRATVQQQIANFTFFPLCSQLQLFLGLMYKVSIIVLSYQNISRGLSIKYNYSRRLAITSYFQRVKQKICSTYYKRSIVLSNTIRYVIGEKNWERFESFGLGNCEKSSVVLYVRPVVLYCNCTHFIHSFI